MGNITELDRKNSDIHWNIAKENLNTNMEFIQIKCLPIPLLIFVFASPVDHFRKCSFHGIVWREPNFIKDDRIWRTEKEKICLSYGGQNSKCKVFFPVQFFWKYFFIDT